MENYEKYAALLADSSAVKLLRARRRAPLIFAFLFRQFKSKQRMTVSNSELVSNLADYLEDLGFTDEDEFPSYTVRAARYLDDWCNEQNRYLSKYQDDSGATVHELTPATEKAFQWMESLEKKEFIGTESRFLDIFVKLRDLIEKSSGDPQKRIEELEVKKSVIEAEIREIQRTGKAEAFSETQIKERFFEINKLARELISDFKEVEQNFRDITRKIYNQHTLRDMSRGAILGYALDAADALQESAQGKSFDAFWRFLLSDARNWLRFGAEERYSEDGGQKQYYEDSQSLSGGQKSKLAYTILASAIAYQFGIQRKKFTRRSLRFVVIDEAFSKVDPENAEYAMELFKRLNLQLMVVTPLDKIAVAEKYVSTVHYVQNKRDRESEVFDLTMEEYQKRKQAYQKEEGLITQT